MSDDSAAAYEKHARAFLDARDRSTVGAAVVDRWARSLASGAEVLEIGCGGGYPVTRVLRDAGLRLWAIDASPRLISEFKARFGDVPVECSHAIASTYFDREFDAVIAIGLMFLLSPEDQETLIHRVSASLREGGRWLFTAPLQVATWSDTTTGHPCLSLGQARYERVLDEAGLEVVANYVDEGGNNYYEAQRRVG